MNVYCIYTKQYSKSVHGMERCRKSCRDYDVNFIEYQSVYHGDINNTQQQLAIKLKYKPVPGSKTNFIQMSAPRTRIANGITHYKLYLECIEINQPIAILEHDAFFIAPPPEIEDPNALVQISSHSNKQATVDALRTCGRANKMHKYGKFKKPYRDWSKQTGIIPHPLSGTNGTSGYIIGPGAAQKMVEYIKQDGVGFADRLREEHIGEGNLYLQVPQCVLCPNDIKSTRME